MTRTFVTADLHLGHTKIIQYEPARRIFATIAEHDAEIERRWRETVRPTDVVYVLGDVAWNRRSLDRVRQFPGIKKLVMGNHDRHDMSAYLEIFRKVVAYAEVAGWLLAHIPCYPGSIVDRYKGQIHGHIHGKVLRSNLALYSNVSVERTDFRPITVEEAIARAERDCGAKLPEDVGRCA